MNDRWKFRRKRFKCECGRKAIQLNQHGVPVCDECIKLSDVLNTPPEQWEIDRAIEVTRENARRYGIVPLQEQTD